MTKKSEKENRNEILRQLKEKEKVDFNKSLPMDKETFNDLFDYLDERLGEGCDHTMTMTLDFFKQREVRTLTR